MTPLEDAVARVWAEFGVDEVLEGASIETWLAVADGGELSRVTGFLVAALVEGRIDPSDRAAVLRQWASGAGAERWASVIGVADAWWDHARWADPEVPAHLLLADLCHLGEPMSRWLQPWLDDLDGEPAQHLAAAVLADWEAPGFADLPDLRQQCRSWAASESVVFGLTLVGGVHLDDGILGEVFDRLVPLD